EVGRSDWPALEAELPSMSSPTSATKPRPATSSRYRRGGRRDRGADRRGAVFGGLLSLHNLSGTGPTVQKSVMVAPVRPPPGPPVTPAKRARAAVRLNGGGNE